MFERLFFEADDEEAERAIRERDEKERARKRQAEEVARETALRLAEEEAAIPDEPHTTANVPPDPGPTSSASSDSDDYARLMIDEATKKEEQADRLCESSAIRATTIVETTTSKAPPLEITSVKPKSELDLDNPDVGVDEWRSMLGIEDKAKADKPSSTVVKVEPEEAADTETTSSDPGRRLTVAVAEDVPASEARAPKRKEASDVAELNDEEENESREEGEILSDEEEEDEEQKAKSGRRSPTRSRSSSRSSERRRRKCGRRKKHRRRERERRRRTSSSSSRSRSPSRSRSGSHESRTARTGQKSLSDRFGDLKQPAGMTAASTSAAPERKRQPVALSARSPWLEQAPKKKHVPQPLLRPISTETVCPWETAPRPQLPGSVGSPSPPWTRPPDAAVSSIPPAGPFGSQRMGFHSSMSTEDQLWPQTAVGGRNPIESLQLACQKNGWGEPIYRQRGLDEQGRVLFDVKVNGRIFSSRVGGVDLLAGRHEAAMESLRQLRVKIII